MTIMSAQRTAVALERNSIRDLGDKNFLDKEKHNDENDKQANDKQRMNLTAEQQQQQQQAGEGDAQDDFMTRLVDGPCRGLLLFPMMSPDDPPCSGVAETATGSCQATLEQPLDFFTHCRQPLEFLSFFHESDDPESGSTVVEVAVLPAGALRLHSYCEYCNSTDIKDCDPQKCTRPPLYFQKKRPPFCPMDPTKWDPITEEPIQRIISTSNEQEEKQTSTTTTTTNHTTAERRLSWVSGFFGSGS